MIESYPNLVTEIVCAMVESQVKDVDRQTLQISDLKGALQNGNPVREKESVYFKLVQAAIGAVDWEFVGEWLKKEPSKELIKS